MVLDDAFRGLFRWRAVWLTLTVLGSVVFGFFLVAVAVYLLVVEGPVFGPGELPGLFATLAGSLGLAVLGAYGLSIVASRIRAAGNEHGFGAWLPPADATDGDRRIDFPAETVRLRRLARRAAALILVWAASAGGGVAGMALLDAAADDLLATGARVYGVVLSVHDPVRGTPSMQVRYGTRTAKIVRDSGRGYYVGEEVTVVQDRADPERVRTTEEKNENQVFFGFTVVLLVAGLGGAPFAVWAALGWRRRARAVAATGWRIATVDVVPDRTPRGPRRHRPLPDIHVRYREGTGLVLRAARSTHRAKAMADYTDRLAWIGGWGPDMVVLFPNGPRKPGPYAIPAYARTPRDAAGLSRSRR